MPPGIVPILSSRIDDAPVCLKELVGDLKDREHQSTLRAPCNVTAARLAPHELTGPRLDALGRPFLVDEVTSRT